MEEDRKLVDFLLFMGQSNMAGRGDASLAPAVTLKAGYEYRAISQPDCLVPLTEPFGVSENNPQGVWEPGMKTGSMVSSFVNACYERTKVPVVGISCSKGGSSIREWIPGTDYYRDASHRYRKGIHFLQAEGILPRSQSLVWCQGCTDADNGMEKTEYKEKTKALLEGFIGLGIEQVFLIQIGNHRDDADRYVQIQEAQKELADEMERVILVSDRFKEFAKAGLMKDCFHYLQEGYNLVGAEAGEKAGNYLHQNY